MTSGLIGISSKIFIQTPCRELGVIMWVQFLDGLPPKIWDGEKRSKSGAISDNFRLWSQISAERIHKSKIEKVVHQLQPLLRWSKKVGEIWSTDRKVIDVHIDPPKSQMVIVRETIFRPLRGDVPSYFLYALEIAEDVLTHTQTGTGVTSPPQKIMMKI